jgi:hypothetical protein
MRVLMMAAALALAACSPSGCSNEAKQDEQSADTAAAGGAEGCAATASAPWNVGSETITVQGATTGADCASAEASISFHRGDAAAMYQETYSASQVMGLGGASSAADMQERLLDWVTQDETRNSTGDLPEWAANADNPGTSELPFRPYGIDRDAYIALRTADAPMFCFVKGMESQACFWWDAGAFRRIGEQQLPG